MPSSRAKMPTVDLASYRPALSYAVQAIRYREAELLDRFEVVAFREAREARRELEELAERVEGGT